MRLFGWFACLVIVMIAVSCSSSEPHAALQEALIFHASWDEDVHADQSNGDGRMFTFTGADTPDTPGVDAQYVSIVPGAGKYGGALRFDPVLPNPHRVYYQARGNTPYSESAWGGTVSYWLNLNPNTDLPRRFSDPIQLIERRYNDAAIWQDFSDDEPRDLGVGIFPDGPDHANTEGIPESEQPRMRVKNPGWQRGDWHHVVITWEHINSGQSNGGGTLYLDGHRAGRLEGRNLRFTWDLDRAAIRVGVNYVGFMDDLAVFSRPLTVEEIQTLRNLENGMKDLR